MACPKVEENLLMHLSFSKSTLAAVALGIVSLNPWSPLLAQTPNEEPKKKCEPGSMEPELFQVFFNANSDFCHDFEFTDFAEEVSEKYAKQLQRKKNKTALKKSYQAWLKKMAACGTKDSCWTEQLLQRKLQLEGPSPTRRLGNLIFHWEIHRRAWIPVFTRGAPEKALKKINQAVLQREFPNEEDPRSRLESIQLARNQSFLEVTWPEYCTGGCPFSVVTQVFDLSTGEPFGFIAGEATSLEIPTQKAYKLAQKYDKETVGAKDTTGCSEELALESGRLTARGLTYYFEKSPEAARSGCDWRGFEIPVTALKKSVKTSAWKKILLVQNYCSETGLCTPTENIGPLEIQWDSTPSKGFDPSLWFPKITKVNQGDSLDGKVWTSPNEKLKEIFLSKALKASHFRVDNGYFAAGWDAQDAAFGGSLALDLKTGETRPTVYLDAPSLNVAMMDEIARSPEGGKVNRMKLEDSKECVPENGDDPVAAELFQKSRLNRLELSLDGKWVRVFYSTDQDKKEGICGTEGRLPLKAIESHLSPASKKIVAETAARCQSEPTCEKPFVAP